MRGYTKGNSTAKTTASGRYIAGFASAKWIITLLMLLSGILPASANHLVGGSVAYEYVKKNADGTLQYKLTFTMYRDCTPSLNNPAFDDPISVGFYENNNTMPLYGGKAATFRLYSKRNVSPPGNSKCANQPDICIEEGIYIGTVNLPASSSGYYFQFARCCRSHKENISDDQGQTYQGFIPSYVYKNSSPVFSDIPAPYFCAGDTSRLLYTATDPDGDSLTYELVRPWGGGSKGQPTPAANKNYVAPPVVSYNAGYSYLNPFGSGGYASIDAVTGLLKIYGLKQGNYALAVDVYEWRNGVLLSTTRRDIQIILEACDPNPAPALSGTNGGSSATTYYLYAGEKLNFDIYYLDPEDSLTMTYSGDIFKSSVTNPAATLTQNGVTSTSYKGFKSVRGSFSWNTSCQQARSQPYIFYVKVTDNGCPAKTTYQTFTIYVLPFKGVDQITGNTTVCEGSPLQLYKANPKSKNGRLFWKIEGGMITSRNDSVAVLVKWGKYTSGKIKVVEINTTGCVGDTASLNVTILPRPSAITISGPANTCANKTYQYFTANHAGSVYSWLAKDATIVSGSGTNSIALQWTGRDTTWLRVVERSSNGCYGDTASLMVIVANPVATKIFGTQSICPFAKLVDYWAAYDAGSSYYWIVQGGTQASGGNSSHIKVNWGGKGPGRIRLVETAKFACVGDTLNLDIVKEYSLHTPPIQGDTSVCEYTKGLSYRVLGANGSKYDWKVKGGTLFSGNGTPEIRVDWGKASTAELSVQESAFDSVNGLQCIGEPVLLPVKLNPNPVTSQITGNTEMCEGDTALFSVKGFSGSHYLWHINGKRQVSDSNAIYYPIIKGGDPGDTVRFDVMEISKDSCVGPLRATTLHIKRLPVTSNITGPTIVCMPDLNGVQYSVKGVPGHTYQWTVDGGFLVNDNNTNTMIVDWTRAGLRWIGVREVNELGCPGTESRLNVEVDSLQFKVNNVTTSEQNDNNIELDWQVLNGQYLKRKVRIYRQSSAGGAYMLVDSVAPLVTHYLDKRVQTNQFSYNYRVEAENICGTPVRSDVHKSILLSVSDLNDSTKHLVWSDYQGWPVRYYSTLHHINELPDSVLPDNTTALTQDKISSLRAYRECYRIMAVDNLEEKVVSYSNRVCVEIKPHLYIPNAFTPGHLDYLNDQFRTVATHYRTFNIRIFNRWGELIFQSDDPEKMWDGTFNGKPCPQDVYLYTAQLQGIKADIYQNGTISLIR